MASRILVLDPVSASRILVASLLKANHYEVRVAGNLETAGDWAAGWVPDAVLIGLAGRSPKSVLDSFHDRRFGGSIHVNPLVLCLDRDATPERRLEALTSGARDLISAPLPDRLMLAHVRCLMREASSLREVSRRQSAAAKFGFAEASVQFQEPDRVAVVCEGPGVGMARHALHMAFGKRYSCITAHDALANTNGTPGPDVFVLDACSTEARRALDLLPELRTRDHSRNAAILLMHPAADRAVAEAALDGGASDIMPCDALSEEAVHRVSALFRRQAAEEALRRSTEVTLRLAATDPLTGLYNRRYANAYLADTIRTAAASNDQFTVMLADIDHFKSINDRFGHAAGDDILVEVATRIRSNMRAIDLVARIGGEEFLIVLPGTPLQMAKPAADRLRTLIGHSPISVADGRSVEVTMSVGVVVGTSMPHRLPNDFPWPGDSGVQDTIRSLLERADQALYSAKTAGRNRVVMSANSV